MPAPIPTSTPASLSLFDAPFPPSGILQMFATLILLAPKAPVPTKPPQIIDVFATMNTSAANASTGTFYSLSLF